MGSQNSKLLSVEEVESQGVHVDEIPVTKTDIDGPLCDRCVNFRTRSGHYMCLKCNMYLCGECFEENVNRCRDCYKDRFNPTNKRICNKTKLQKQIIEDSMKDKYRREMILQETVVRGTVRAKHELDNTTCLVTGLCGLSDKRWALCDYNNNCLKIFSVGLIEVQRYIKFDSNPSDITEITMKTELNRKDKSQTKVVNGTMNSSVQKTLYNCEPDTKHLIAVTFPFLCQIVVLDLNQTPVIRNRILQTDNKCYSLASSGDKLFVVCETNPQLNVLHSVYIMSVDGKTSKVINTSIGPRYPYIAVTPGRIYLTDYQNHNIKCLYGTGKQRSQAGLTTPSGIDINPHNVVFVTGKICSLSRMDSDLLLLPTDETTCHLWLDGDKPRALCFHMNRIFVSYNRWSKMENSITVIRLE